MRILLKQAHDTAEKILKDNEEKLLLMTDLLMEFETLDQADVKAIMKGEWNSDDKRKKLEEATSSTSRKTPPPPPKDEKPLKGGPEISPA